MTEYSLQRFHDWFLSSYTLFYNIHDYIYGSIWRKYAQIFLSLLPYEVWDDVNKCISFTQYQKRTVSLSDPKTCKQQSCKENFTLRNMFY